jgi:cbb3-type cytochrome oxidase subunit 3
MFSNSFNNFAGSVMALVNRGTAWISQQDYSHFTKMDEMTYLTIATVTVFGFYLMFMFYALWARKKEDVRVNKRKFVPEEFEEQDRQIKRRLSIQAEKYRHASAFQTIQQQVGEDPRSWPVVLLNEVILLREDLARLQKKTF